MVAGRVMRSSRSGWESGRTGGPKSKREKKDEKPPLSLETFPRHRIHASVSPLLSIDSSSTMSSYAPEPSPAPTLAGVPGYYFPETPDSTTHDDPLDRQTSTAAPATESRPSPDADPNDEYAHKVNNAVGVGIASLGGLVVGGPVGAVIAGGIVGLVESENDGLRAHANEVEPNSATSKDAPEDKAFEVQGENAQHALEESPAQKLVNPDDADEGSKLTGAGALGGALLAGGAGAKVAENEVSEPSEDNSLTPTATHQALPVSHV